MGSYYATQSDTLRPAEPIVSRLLQALLAVAGGFSLFVLLLVGLAAGYGMKYSGMIYPGVSVAGIDLSGMKTGQAAVLLAQRLDYPNRGQIVFKDGAKMWVAKPSEVGLYVDTESSAMTAYQVGRAGDPLSNLAGEFQSWYSGVSLSPVLIFDGRVAQTYLTNLAAQVNRPIVEASLGVNGVDVVVRSGQVGREMDIPAAVQAVEKQVRTMTDGIVPLTVRETPPVILDVTQQAELAKRILSAPLTLTVPDASKDDPGPWTFDQPTLAKMLTIQRVDGANGSQYQVGLDVDSLRPFLEKQATKLARTPQDARFTFNDDTRQLELLQNAVIGRSLDVDATIQDINQKVAAGEHQVALHIAYTQPQVTDNATAEKLGITELVSEQTSYFYGSSDSRIHNIQTAAGRFHGVLVPPGGTFSMADVLGDVSLDTGYAEALIIYGDRTIQGVGGGVCQVSTTLFRTVFFGGYPVVERHSHAYRVGYYEQTASGGHDADLAGLDATVFVPMVDFKFTNDSPSWLLMETYVSPGARTLTWKFYSTSDGRKVDWETTGPQNVVDLPPPVYEENPDLGKGEIKQVDYEAQGADISVNRTVTRDGQVLYQDTFATHYLPWRAVYQYGPGTKDIPTPEPTDKP